MLELLKGGLPYKESLEHLWKTATVGLQDKIPTKHKHAHDFVHACLTVDPSQRPEASSLLLVLVLDHSYLFHSTSGYKTVQAKNRLVSVAEKSSSQSTN